MLQSLLMRRHHTTALFWSIQSRQYHFCKYVPIKGVHLQGIHGKDSDKYRFLVTDYTAELNE